MISFLKKQAISAGFSVVDGLMAWKKRISTGRRTAFFVFFSVIIGAAFMNPAAHAGDKKHESKFKVKAALESKIDIQNNRDLDSGRDDSLSVLDPELSVGILYKATNYF